ncbi:unnamed protein product [Cunninghamella blakesleeana]
MIKLLFVCLLMIAVNVSAWTCACMISEFGTNEEASTEKVCYLFYGGKINKIGSCYNITPGKKSPEKDFDYFCKKQSKSLQGFCY